eukprot:gene31294-38665_t
MRYANTSSSARSQIRFFNSKDQQLKLERHQQRRALRAAVCTATISFSDNRPVECVALKN